MADLHVVHLTLASGKTLPSASAWERHRAFLEQHHKEGRFLLSGSLVAQASEPVFGEMIIAVGPFKALEAVMARDPLVRSGAYVRAIHTIDPSRLSDELESLIDGADESLSAATRTETDRDWAWGELRELRRPGHDLARVLAERSLEPVAQHAGTALLTRFVPPFPVPSPIAEQARRCVTALRARDWYGDDILAHELLEALGDPWPPLPEPGDEGEIIIDERWDRGRWPLTPAAVSLDELADVLDGDPRQGSGVIDLVEGTVHSPGVLGYDPPAAMDEESADYEPGRWLVYRPDSHDSFRDMERFADVVGGRWRVGLMDALEGRGAFRRFRQTLSGMPERYQERWRIYSAERRIGRARDFLARAGYRAARPNENTPT